MVGAFIKGGLVSIFLLSGIVALMAGQSVAGVILLLSAFIFHRF
ncbi:MAG: hypothetical protein ACYC69_02965 [Thermodesulfovibrionales bacterium]